MCWYDTCGIPFERTCGLSIGYIEFDLVLTV